MTAAVDYLRMPAASPAQVDNSGVDEVSIGVLGPLEVTVNGAPCTLSGSRQKRLLAFLLIRANAAISPDQVIDALWDDVLPATALSQVRNAVAKLRRDLGRAGATVVTDSRSYCLRIDDDQADVLRFSRSVKRARELVRAGADDDTLEAVRAGLALWRGLRSPDWTAGCSRRRRHRWPSDGSLPVNS